jgi:hypothetical protein
MIIQACGCCHSLWHQIFGSWVKCFFMPRKKSGSRDKTYRERNTDRSRQTGNINSRNNNQDVDAAPRVSSDEEPTVKPGSPGIGDSAWNNDKLTNYTSNHSSDA